MLVVTKRKGNRVRHRDTETLKWGPWKPITDADKAQFAISDEVRKTTEHMERVVLAFQNMAEEWREFVRVGDLIPEVVEDIKSAEADYNLAYDALMESSKPDLQGMCDREGIAYRAKDTKAQLVTKILEKEAADA